MAIHSENINFLKEKQKMVPIVGIEPIVTALSAQHSTIELNRHLFCNIGLTVFGTRFISLVKME